MTPAKRRPAKPASKEPTRATTKDSTQEAPTEDAGEDSAPPTETEQGDPVDRAPTQRPGDLAGCTATRLAGLMLPSRRLPLVGRPVVDVAVGVLAPDGRVLLTERTAGKGWPASGELPGGQVDPGESPAQAAGASCSRRGRRPRLELAPWRFYEHDFPGKRVRLHWFHVRRWSGEANGGKASGWHGWTPPARRSGLCCRATDSRRDVGAPRPGGSRPGEPRAGRSDELLAGIPSLVADGLRLLIVRAPELAPARASSSPAGCARRGGGPGCVSSCPGRRSGHARAVRAGCTAAAPRWPA